MNPILVTTSTEQNEGILVLIYATDSHFFWLFKDTSSCQNYWWTALFSLLIFSKQKQEISRSLTLDLSNLVLRLV